jgi:hypothetical protein
MLRLPPTSLTSSSRHHLRAVVPKAVILLEPIPVEEAIRIISRDNEAVRMLSLELALPSRRSACLTLTLLITRCWMPPGGRVLVQAMTTRAGTICFLVGFLVVAGLVVKVAGLTINVVRRDTKHTLT